MFTRKSFFVLFLSFLISSFMFNCTSGEDISDSTYAQMRKKMVERQLAGRDITDNLVLDVMSKIPRHLFVPEKYRSQAYEDHPLPIGYDQTISQPYIVALMTQLLDLKGGEIVLEIGTGSGYQAAVLAEICSEVYSIEIVPELAKSSAERLASLGYTNVHIACGDGYKGWQDDNIKFDRVIITAAPPEVPQKLLDQLKIGGKLVVPEGDVFQYLRLYVKHDSKIERKNIIPVRFVPMIHSD